MGRRTKKDKADPLIRGVLAANLAVLRNRAFPALATITAKNLALAKAADTTLSQIQRVLSRELGTSIDLLARIANALKVRPQDLLTPYFAVQPDQLPGGEALGDTTTFQRNSG